MNPVAIRELWLRRDERLLLVLGATPVCYMGYLYPGRAEVFNRLFGYGLTGIQHQLVFLAYRQSLALVFMGLLPLIMIKCVLRERLSGYGLGLSEVGYNLKFLLLGMAVVIPITGLAAHNPEFQQFYPQLPAARDSAVLFLISSALYLLYYFGYEVLFRGFLLFGIERRLGAWPAILMSTVATTLVHVTRPAGEYGAALLAGFVFGYVALRTRSLWGVLLLHFITGVSLDFFCVVTSSGWN